MTGSREFTAAAERYTLFAALRLLESTGNGAPIGTARRLRDDPLRLVQPPHLKFAASEVASIEAGPEVTRVRQYSFGMMGPNGPLPLHLTEYIHARLHQEDDAALADFLTAIQHRLATLFYRAWAASDPTALQAEPFAGLVGSLVGLGSPESRNADSVHLHAKLRRAGVLAQQSRSAEGLQILLQDYLGVPVQVASFVGEWVPIAADATLRLGERSNSGLGVGASLGAKSWQSASRFEVVVGPVPLDRFEALLPGSTQLASVRDLVALYTNREWNWALRLGTTTEHSAPVTLSAGARLGWTSWLGNPERGSVDVVLRGDEMAA